MTREELKKQTIIILNRDDITIEEMTENILQLVDIAMNKELRLYGVVQQSEQFNCYEMHAYSRFAGCSKQCKECANNEKSKAI